jgi:hypothetical protein
VIFIAWTFALVLGVAAVFTAKKRLPFVSLALGLSAVSLPLAAHTGVWLVTLIVISLLVAVSSWAFKLNSSQFGLLGSTLALYLALGLLGADLYLVVQMFFWIFWLVGLVIAIRAKSFKRGYGAAFAVFIISVLMVAGNGLMSLSNSPHHATGSASVIVDQNGKKTEMDLVSNDTGTSESKPISGTDTTSANLRPSLDDGKGPVVSWGNLVERVNALPADKKAAYIAAINQRSEYLGTWEDVQKYAAAEKGTGVDTRVILVLNSSVTDQQARDTVGKTLGATANKLSVVQTTGALVNTRGVETGAIADFADERSQIRVILTTPVKVNELGKIQLVANTKAAQSGVGVLTECTNPSTGIVTIVRRTPPSRTTSTAPKTSTSTSPSTATPTKSSSTAPSTKPPTTTTPPTTTPPTTAPPTTQPPATTPPATCPPGQTGTPPECLATKDPGDNIPGPSGKPTAPAPSGPAETTPPKESNPANPGDKPGDEVTAPAPGATQTSRSSIPSAVPTVAPNPSSPGTGDKDPDMALASFTGSNTSGGGMIATLAAFFALLFLLNGVRRNGRRRTDA